MRGNRAPALPPPAEHRCAICRNPVVDAPAQDRDGDAYNPALRARWEHWAKFEDAAAWAAHVGAQGFTAVEPQDHRLYRKFKPKREIEAHEKAALDDRRKDRERDRWSVMANELIDRGQATPANFDRLATELLSEAGARAVRAVTSVWRSFIVGEKLKDATARDLLGLSGALRNEPAGYPRVPEGRYETDAERQGAVPF